LVPIAFVCFGIWYYFLRTRRHLLAAIRDSAGMAEALARGNVISSLELLRDRLAALPGAMPAAVRAAVADILAGTQPAEALETHEAKTLSLMQRDFVVLAALTVVAPLLGLLGTVMGMIETFEAVAVVSGKTSENVASGISKALITTQFGLVVAIPGIFGLARLHRLFDHVRVRLAQCRTHLLLAIEGPGRGDEREWR
jgi:biopolymer transport protein ExbB/TolQ